MKKSILVLLSFIFFTAIQAQTFTGNLNISSQSQLDILSTYTEVTGYVDISGADIIDLSKLSSLTTVGGRLYIGSNTVLTNLDGLSSLTTLGEDINIYANAALTNLDGLSSLTTVGDYLEITDNAVLTEFCGIYPLINGSGLGDYYFVDSNASNPTEQEIIDGGACAPPPPPDVPLSNWAIIVSMLFIAVFIGYRKRLFA